MTLTQIVLKIHKLALGAAYTFDFMTNFEVSIRF